ncbi:MAG: SPFH domain-containing protein [Bacillota bacterium]|nr:SPFH domain-containing protein [Bacillota bacterium]
MSKKNIEQAFGTPEREAWKWNGFLGILLILLLCGLGVWACVGFSAGSALWTLFLILGIIGFCLAFVLLCGLVIVQPNNAAVITFFGRYMGVIRENGVWLTVPFSAARKVSLRVRNFNSEKLKVNDTNGNPIEIAAVIVFKVTDPAKALLDVNNYEQFVEIQSETSLRHVAAQYPYDDFDEGRASLRSNADEVSRQLQDELQARLDVAGVQILEARLTHLAYATEIASAMLQRQQAAAILAARQIIVDGAVGMAQMAIEKLEAEAGCQLDEERKMSMINNLMVSIITDRSSQPVINVGSMY